MANPTAFPRVRRHSAMRLHTAPSALGHIVAATGVRTIWCLVHQERTRWYLNVTDDGSRWSVYRTQRDTIVTISEPDRKLHLSLWLYMVRLPVGINEIDLDEFAGCPAP